ncbi:putative tyrosine phosphatase [Tribonema minus]|uniref:very-long-chain (3R)-3-hydroxyacyl-CoA dehydratase n=1 Tax=Tribonema minus TaxID=303371 RepID=A0A835ZGJ3_9STRA|nr:putative tyrosine phosphatase [Tribonema minus]
MGFGSAYLGAYNLACAGGWAFALVLFAKAQYEGASWRETWNSMSTTVMAVQTVAVMEILHSLVGLVPSPWMTTLLQVSSRLVVAWGFLYSCEASQDHYAMALTTVSWALVEVPRYLFYVFNIMGNVPYPLFWLRYSLFAVLYPSGITGEIMTIVNGFDCLKALKPVPLAGGISISMYHMALLVLATYVPGAPFMYSHMVTTRRKQFKRRKAASKKAE